MQVASSSATATTKTTCHRRVAVLFRPMNWALNHNEPTIIVNITPTPLLLLLLLRLR
jgi:hypothetical protein